MSKDKKPKNKSEIGYGRPPVHTQFKPGQSGNRRGRPKFPRDIEAVARRALNKKAIVTVQGRRRRLTKLEITFDQLANKSASGDIQAALAITKLMGYPKKKIEETPKMEKLIQMAQHKMPELSDEEFETLEGLLRKLGLADISADIE